jgi:hypothetical protein
MTNNLSSNSGIWVLKSKFFFYRLITYFSFLLLPILLPKTLNLPTFWQVLLMTAYSCFMFAQWFLLGKEIDYRLKIYYKVNSSLDRMIYRVITGMIFFVLLFNVLNFLPSKWIYNTYWIVWSIIGLFYSWPTRGKIIQESVSTNFYEFKYLDRFEKTLVIFILLMFGVSLPELAVQETLPALKLFFDPLELYSSHLWNFLSITYYPFMHYPSLFKNALSVHFYVIHMGLFLITLYALLRNFVSRRLSLLGVFAVVSSWSYSKILGENPGVSLSTTYSLFWVWSCFWATKSSTYKSGLFIGLISYWGALINQSFAILFIPYVLYFYFYTLRDKTEWYKRQFLRYVSFGFGLIVLLLITHHDFLQFSESIDRHYMGMIRSLFDRKAFFTLSIIGAIVLFLKYTIPSRIGVLKSFSIDKELFTMLGGLFVIQFIFAFFVDQNLLKNFGIMWVISLMSLIPIELLFQTISRFRSKRNMIYLIYILVCLLDSHFEGRVKIIMRIFSS